MIDQSFNKLNENCWVKDVIYLGNRTINLVKALQNYLYFKYNKLFL